MALSTLKCVSHYFFGFDGTSSNMYRLLDRPLTEEERHFYLTEERHQRRLFDLPLAGHNLAVLTLPHPVDVHSQCS